MYPTVHTATMCCNMVTSADELGRDALADGSNEEWNNRLKGELRMTWKLAHLTSTVSQMKSTAKRCRILTQSVDDVCKLYHTLTYSSLSNMLVTSFTVGDINIVVMCVCSPPTFFCIFCGQLACDNRPMYSCQIVVGRQTVGD